jgi:peroxin-1
MARPARAEVVLTGLKNCLVNLPSSLVSVLNNSNVVLQNVVVELQWRSQTQSSGAVSSGNAAGFQKSAYVGWTGMPSRSRTSSLTADRRRPASREQDSQGLEIDAAFAKLLGLSEGQKLSILLHLDPPVATTVNIEPLTPADWEAIELHANFLELNFLSQVRALPNPSFSSKTVAQAEVKHPLTLHLSPTSTANIVVTSLAPLVPDSSPFAKIAADAEVIVAPKTRPGSTRSRGGDSRSITSRRSGKSGGTSRGGQRKKGEAMFLRGFDRSVGSTWFNEDERDASNTGLRVWLSKEALATKSLRGAAWVTVSIVKPAGLRTQLDQPQMQKLKDEEASEVGLPASKIVARALPWASPIDDQHMALSSKLCEILGVHKMVGLIVRIDAAPSPLPRYSLKSYRFFPHLGESSKKKEGLKFGGESRLSRQNLVDRLRLAYGGDDNLLTGSITDGMTLPSTPDFDGGIIRLNVADTDRKSSPLWVLGHEQKQDFEAYTEVPRPVPLATLFPSFPSELPEKSPELVSVDAVIKQCMSNLELCSSLLLTGGTGSGKTSLAHLLCHRLRKEYLVSARYMSCQTLVTDEIQIPKVKEILTKVFMSAAWCARLGGQAVVVLDDLDKICPVETELQVGNDNGRSLQITELLCSIVRQYCSVQSGVSLLATAQSKEALHNLIIGGHIVGDIIALKAPSKEDRRMILQTLTHHDAISAVQSRGINGHGRNSSDSNSTVEDSWMDPSNPSSRPGSSSSAALDGFHISPSLDLLEVAGKTDGYMAADLALLVSRARNQALIRTVSTPDEGALTLMQADFVSALKGFTPSSLRNVTLTHSSTTFSEVGGLAATRNTLLETLMYPTKYAPIFASSPLRLRSGILLYGYPGCGKTLLASAVAGECNLNFISVKGPEILNKYIGASEKSVRDLFERAQAAKPCVLFFDEFDSIAPKRGHDSTGVTDRVVNQMLTQMDGAEGLEGVYVLAATSRPDLIDPALLRPGRLDKSLLCDMPSTADRADILRAVSEKLHLQPSISSRLTDIAAQTEGFSGADLQALMYNAHLEAIHDLLGDSKAGDPKKEKLTNGNAKHGKKHKDKHDFINFLYDPERDSEARKLVSASKNASLSERAAIIAKLDALKLQRKREKAAQRGISTLNSGSSTSNIKGLADEKEEVVIEWRHIERSLATTRSSISADERRRLAAIYNEFVVGRNGEMPSGDGGREVGGRSSLM